MNQSLPDLVSQFSTMTVAVIGEAMLDVYLEGSAERLCREAPVPVVAVHARRDAPGGAANTAANLRTLGAQVAFLSVVGDDSEGVLVRDALERRAVATDCLLTEASRRTLVKQRVIADDQVLLRFDQGSAEALTASAEDRLIAHLNTLYPRCDAVIVSDYGYGILTPRVIQALAELQARHSGVLVIDARNPASYRHVGATAVKPNYDEAVRLLGAPALRPTRSRVEQMTAHGPQLLGLTGARICAVTLDSEGALLIERDHPPYRTYARPQPNSRAAGAGDTFTSTLTLALAAGAGAPAAAELASAAASIVIGKAGTVTCSAQDLREHLAAGSKVLADATRLAARAELYHQQGRRLVFTNGCFDILHRGHITCLNQAKALGDALIVGINTDAGVRRLKGSDRPINTLDDRIQVLAALSCVDYIIAFDDDSPEAIIRALRPHVFAKGGNYTREGLPEASLVEALGGRVELLPYTPERSTSAVIERIRATYSQVA